MLVAYSSNNSGGGWWLTDEDWKNLEAAGWTVEWARDNEYLRGHLDDDGEHWMGTLASRARKEFASLKEALEEFERITGQNVTDEGCNCCGPPHSFNWDAGGCSGSDCAEILFGEAPSYRELLERGGGGR